MSHSTARERLASDRLGRSAGSVTGQRCAARPAPLDGELPPSVSRRSFLARGSSGPTESRSCLSTWIETPGAYAQQPCLWLDHERTVRCGREPVDIIDADRAAGMAEPVRQHLVHGVGYFPHRAQHVHVKALRKYLAPAAKCGIERLRNANGDPLHAARERRPIVGFADHVEVVPLHRKMDDTKSISLLSSSERRQHRSIALPAAQALEPG